MRVIPALPVVFAYRDQGPVLKAITNWCPRRVYCTQREDHSDAPGTEYVVKFRQGSRGAAALISEVVCGCLFEAAGTRVPEAALVRVSGGLARSYASSGLHYCVEPGLHFGTKFISDAQPGHLPSLTSLEQLSDPQQLVDLWVLDSWVMTIDRTNYGNVLLRPDGRGRWHLVAADQSDCFCGSGCLCDNTVGYTQSGSRELYRFLEAAVIAAGGKRAVRKSIDRVRVAAQYLESAIARVPVAWWNEAGVDPRSVGVGLETRAHRIEEIVKISRWEGIGDAGSGGTVLDL